MSFMQCAKQRQQIPLANAQRMANVLKINNFNYKQLKTFVRLNILCWSNSWKCCFVLYHWSSCVCVWLWVCGHGDNKQMTRSSSFYRIQTPSLCWEVSLKTFLFSKNNTSNAASIFFYCAHCLFFLEFWPLYIRSTENFKTMWVFTLFCGNQTAKFAFL